MSDATDPTPQPTPLLTPTRRIVTVRNERALRRGWITIGVGIVLVVIGSVVTFSSQALQVATAEGRAQVGSPITFEAEDGATYAITVIPEPGTSDLIEDRIGQLGCEVEHADGSTEELDASSADIRTSSSVGTFATDFEGRGGETTVRCTCEGSVGLGSFYAVAETHRATRYLATGAIGIGILIGLVGVAALIRGYQGRTELQDIEPIEPIEPTGPIPPT